MANIFLDSCGDHMLVADIAQKYSDYTNTFGTISRVSARNGNGWRMQAGDFITRIVQNVTDGPSSSGANATLTTGFALKRTAGYPLIDSAGKIFTFMSATTNQLILQLDPTGLLTLWTGGSIGSTRLARSTVAVDIQGFQYIELQAKIHNTTGSFGLKIDGNFPSMINSVGNPIANPSTNVNTGSAAGCDRVRWGQDVGSGIDLVWDDIYLNDDATTDHMGKTTTQTGFMGDGAVTCLFPVAAGNYSQFNRSPDNGANTNWQNVDDGTPNGDTDYNYHTADQTRDSFDMTTLSSASGIKAVQIISSCRSSIQTRYIQGTIRQGGADYPSTDKLSNVFAVGTSAYSMRRQCADVDPSDGAAWTTAKINTMEPGYKLIISTTGLPA